MVVDKAQNRRAGLLHPHQLFIGLCAQLALTAFEVVQKVHALAAEPLGIGQRRFRLGCPGRSSGLGRHRHERIVQVQGTEIVADGGVGQIAIAHGPGDRVVGFFLFDLRLTGQARQVAHPVISGAQQLAQAAEIGQLFHARNSHEQKAQRDRCENAKQNRDSHKLIVGQAQRARANSGQDAHDQRRDTEAAGKGPAYGSQHNTDGLTAVFPLAFQAAFPGSESVGLFHSHRVPRLFQSVGNAAQHRRADLAAHLNRVVDHIA